MNTTLPSLRSFGLLALALAWAVAAPALAWSPPPSVEKSLVDGQPWSEVIADGRGAGLIHAAIDIAAPPSVVWSVLTHCGPPGRHAVALKSCKVLSGDQREGWDVRERITKGSFLTPSIRDVVYTQYTPLAAIHFHRVDGDLKAEEGETRLEPINGGIATRVIYVNRIAMSTVLPDALLITVMRHTTPNVMLNLQRTSLAALGPGPFAALSPPNPKRDMK